MDRNRHLKLIAGLRKRIQSFEDELIAQNLLIATLERTGEDAREACAIGPQLRVDQEADLAEMERLAYE